VVHEVQLVLTPLHAAQPAAHLEHVFYNAKFTNYPLLHDVPQLELEADK
jgi:hypothetical protein